MCPHLALNSQDRKGLTCKNNLEPLRVGTLQPTPDQASHSPAHCLSPLSASWNSVQTAVPRSAEHGPCPHSLICKLSVGAAPSHWAHPRWRKEAQDLVDSVSHSLPLP